MRTFYIYNAVRSVETRTARAGHRSRMVQYVGKGQQRVLRNRPLVLTEPQLLECLDEVRAKVASGVLLVKTTDGRRVDLNSLEPMTPAVTPPLPHPPLDSAKNDSPHVGHKTPQFPGGTAVQDLDAPPSIPEEFLADSEEEVD